MTAVGQKQLALLGEVSVVSEVAYRVMVEILEAGDWSGGREGS